MKAIIERAFTKAFTYLWTIWCRNLNLVFRALCDTWSSICLGLNGQVEHSKLVFNGDKFVTIPLVEVTKLIEKEISKVRSQSRCKIILYDLRETKIEQREPIPCSWCLRSQQCASQTSCKTARQLQDHLLRQKRVTIYKNNKVPGETMNLLSQSIVIRFGFQHFRSLEVESEMSSNLLQLLQIKRLLVIQRLNWPSTSIVHRDFSKTYWLNLSWRSLRSASNSPRYGSSTRTCNLPFLTGYGWAATWAAAADALG